jgi:hypothetical protein
LGLSDDKGDSPSNGSSEFSFFDPGRGLGRNHPWPREHYFIDGASSADEPWSWLPSGGGGEVWASQGNLEAPLPCCEVKSPYDGRGLDGTDAQESEHAKDTQIHCESVVAETVGNNLAVIVQGGMGNHRGAVSGFQEPFVDVKDLIGTHAGSDRWDPMSSEASLVAPEAPSPCSAQGTTAPALPTIDGLGLGASPPRTTNPPAETLAQEDPFPPSVTSPSLETVSFDMPAQHLVPVVATHQTPALAVVVMHVNMARGSETDDLIAGEIPSNPSSFIAKLQKPVASPLIFALAPKRKTKRAPQIPRWSTRLAKKACGHTSAIAAAQNIIMKKLGISTMQQLDAADFECCIKLFKVGLIEEQTRMIHDLFKVQDRQPSATKGGSQ